MCTSPMERGSGSPFSDSYLRGSRGGKMQQQQSPGITGHRGVPIEEEGTEHRATAAQSGDRVKVPTEAPGGGAQSSSFMVP